MTIKIPDLITIGTIILFQGVTKPTFKRSGGCYVCGELGHGASQCRKRATTMRENPPKPKGNLVEENDIIAAVIDLLHTSTF